MLFEQTTPTIPAKSNLYYPALTGIRAFAAYLVFFHHFNPFTNESWPERLVREGHIGVTVFFVLSGFLITTRYLDKTRLSVDWLKGYFQNRIARIYPLYFLLTCVTFLVLLKDPTYDILQQWQKLIISDKALIVFLNLTFLRGFFNTFLFTAIQQGWTLTVEETFYAFAVPLMLVLNLVRGKKQYGVLAVAALGFVGVGCALVYVNPVHRYGFFSPATFMFYRTFFGRAVEFMMGAALALFVRHHSTLRKGAWATAVGGLWMVACLGALACIATKESPSYQNSLGLVVNNLVLPLGISILFYGLLTERTQLAHLLSTKVAQTLGKSSYAFYLVHLGILSVYIQRNISESPVVIFAMALGVAYLLWRFIEEPLQTRLRSKPNHQKKKPLLVSAA